MSESSVSQFLVYHTFTFYNSLWSYEFPGVYSIHVYTSKVLPSNISDKRVGSRYLVPVLCMQQPLSVYTGITFWKFKHKQGTTIPLILLPWQVVWDAGQVVWDAGQVDIEPPLNVFLLCLTLFCDEYFHQDK